MFFFIGFIFVVDADDYLFLIYVQEMPSSGTGGNLGSLDFLRNNQQVVFMYPNLQINVIFFNAE